MFVFAWNRMRTGSASREKEGAEKSVTGLFLNRLKLRLSVFVFEAEPTTSGREKISFARRCSLLSFSYKYSMCEIQNATLEK